LTNPKTSPQKRTAGPPSRGTSPQNLTAGRKNLAANPLKFGLIGVGMMGREHLGNLMALDGAEVVAIADPHLPSRAKLHQVWSEGEEREPLQEFKTHQDLLRADLCDAVVVSTPNFNHKDVLADVFRTSCDVLVEKPLGINVTDCLEIIDLAEAANFAGTAWVGLEYRYMPPVTRLIEEVAAGVVGDVKMVTIREHRFPFLSKVGHWNRFHRSSGGTLVEKCCHFFDLMDLIVGARPSQVFASGSQAVNHLEERYNGKSPDMLDNAYVVVDYPDGARAMLDLCMFADATHNQEEVVAVGDKGKVEAFVPEGIMRLGRRGQHWIGDVETIEVSDSRIAFEGGHNGSSFLEMLAFLEAVVEDKPAEVTLLDGLWSVAVGEAGHRSIDERRPVELAEIMPKSLVGDL